MTNEGPAKTGRAAPTPTPAAGARAKRSFDTLLWPTDDDHLHLTLTTRQILTDNLPTGKKISQASSPKTSKAALIQTHAFAMIASAPPRCRFADRSPPGHGLIDDATFVKPK
ncbi:hypothetical protein EVAR_73165_1 [Eumeta japonica]|uniref:Uncharacterized protein n=1 Tax=Eumeta variegata TaxID=151549 RepID=A0A4C1TH77_EUMVA|nr:hypothetical protein EVAR_73165_1 [Eumeta japonica]